MPQCRSAAVPHSAYKFAQCNRSPPIWRAQVYLNGRDEAVAPTRFDQPALWYLTVGGFLTAHPHSATRLVGRPETSIPEAAELIRRQAAKLSLEFPTTIGRQALETPIGVLNPVTCVRR